MYGIDLFNHGYYWEAHEVWEGLWHVCGRTGTAATFFKGLIKLAASGVKVRQGIPRGVRDLADGARELFEEAAAQVGTDSGSYLGMSLSELATLARSVADRADALPAEERASVAVVFPFALRLTPRG